MKYSDTSCRVASLFLGAGQQDQQTQNDIADHPDAADQAKTERRSNSGADHFSVTCCGPCEVRDCTQRREHPQEHKQVEGNKQQLDQFAKNAAFGFSDRMAAVGAIIGLRRDCAIAAWAGALARDRAGSFRISFHRSAALVSLGALPACNKDRAA